MVRKGNTKYKDNTYEMKIDPDPTFPSNNNQCDTGTVDIHAKRPADTTINITQSIEEVRDLSPSSI